MLRYGFSSSFPIIEIVIIYVAFLFAEFEHVSSSGLISSKTLFVIGIRAMPCAQRNAALATKERKWL